MKTRQAVVFVLILLAVEGKAEPPHSLVFFVSSHRSVRGLTSGDVRRIYLGQISRWSDERRVVLFMRPAGSNAGRFFLDHVVRMSAIDYAQWWIGAIFRGDAAAAPRVVESEDEMFRAVAANPDAVGFALASERMPDSVTVIAIDGRAPSERGYPFTR